MRRADMLIKGQDAENIRLGNTFTEDQHPDGRFAYMLSNPPFGVEWKQEQKHITDEHEKLGYKGRFGPGLPRINDGALLLQAHTSVLCCGGGLCTDAHEGAFVFWW